MKYKIISSNFHKMSELEDEVNNLIAQGWRPLGGVSISISESDDYMYQVAAQAMVSEQGD